MGKAWLLPLVLWFGCGDSSQAPDAGVDAAVDAPPPLDSRTQCNALALPPTPVAETRVAQSVPIAMGGPLVPGVYVVTAATVYTGPAGATGPTGQTYQWRIVSTATTFESLQRAVNGPTDMTVTQNGAYSLSGAMLSITSTCGGAPGTFGFDATPTSFTLYQGTTVWVFTKQ